MHIPIRTRIIRPQGIGRCLGLGPRPVLGDNVEIRTPIPRLEGCRKTLICSVFPLLRHCGVRMWRMAQGEERKADALHPKICQGPQVSWQDRRPRSIRRYAPSNDSLLASMGNPPFRLGLLWYIFGDKLVIHLQKTGVALYGFQSGF